MKKPAALKRMKERTFRSSLAIILAIFVFCVLLVAIGLAFLIVFILIKVGAFSGSEEDFQLIPSILVMLLISLVIGFVIAFFSSRVPLKPINNLINKMNRLSEGDFNARLEFGGALSTHPAFKEISTSFNKMAEELGNTELLRNDFINNFSHEFKTPIVSIYGFAKLLKREDITDEQRKAYLQSIEEESMRLSSMATNVLSLSKVENQTILTNLSTFNISEQIRGVLLLSEEKWSKKNIKLVLDFNEYQIEADEEQLRLVWINLIDNAIKFSPNGGKIEIDIILANELLVVKIINECEEIPKEKLEKLFNKFYQADQSHASQGNGIGLAIVKRIVDLHLGNISVCCENGEIVFEVKLPL